MLQYQRATDASCKHVNRDALKPLLIHNADLRRAPTAREHRLRPRLHGDSIFRNRQFSETLSEKRTRLHEAVFINVPVCTETLETTENT